MLKTTWISVTIIGTCVSLSHGSENAALRFNSYLVKASFKRCKLVPTMLIGVSLTGRRHCMIQHAAALIMCTGLTFLSLADTDTQKVDSSISATRFIGPILLFFATSLDSRVPNLQERLLKQTNVCANRGHDFATWPCFSFSSLRRGVRGSCILPPFLGNNIHVRCLS